MRERLRHVVPVLVGVVLFVVALEVLRREFKAVTWHTLSHDVANTSPTALLVAVVLTVINYAVLTGCTSDCICLYRAASATVAHRRDVVSRLCGREQRGVRDVVGRIREGYRFYTRWGLTAEELSRIVFSLLGHLLVRIVGTWRPQPRAQPGVDPSRPGALGIRAADRLDAGRGECGLCSGTAVRRQPLRLRGLELPLPSVQLALTQLAVSARSTGRSPLPFSLCSCPPVMRRF